jgi:hypothetical protein
MWSYKTEFRACDGVLEMADSVEEEGRKERFINNGAA